MEVPLHKVETPRGPVDSLKTLVASLGLNSNFGVTAINNNGVEHVITLVREVMSVKLHVKVIKFICLFSGGSHISNRFYC